MPAFVVLEIKGKESRTLKFACLEKRLHAQSPPGRPVPSRSRSGPNPLGVDRANRRRKRWRQRSVYFVLLIADVRPDKARCQ